MKPLIVCGLLSALPLFLGPFFPYWHPLLLVPFVVATFYPLPLTTCLWVSLGCGTLFDFLSPGGGLGLYALTYSLATLILFPQKRAFYPGRITTLPLLTVLYTSLVTLIVALLLWPTSQGFSLWWGWILTDLLAMPLIDGLYCLIGVALPLYLLFGRAAKPPPYKMERPK
ncbi:MAG: hypothetical protein AB7F31_01125 [Parachlamydiales bacterium]